MQLIHKSLTVFIQRTYYKITTEESVTFVNKLSVVAPCSGLHQFYKRAAMIKHGLH